jgi:hypothetical protein
VEPSWSTSSSSNPRSICAGGCCKGMKRATMAAGQDKPAEAEHQGGSCVQGSIADRWLWGVGDAQHCVKATPVKGAGCNSAVRSCLHLLPAAVHSCTTYSSTQPCRSSKAVAFSVRCAGFTHQHCDLLCGQLLCVKHGCDELVEVDALRVAVNLHAAQHSTGSTDA